jgi:hypothetical protein
MAGVKKQSTSPRQVEGPPTCVRDEHFRMFYTNTTTLISSACDIRLVFGDVSLDSEQRRIVLEHGCAIMTPEQAKNLLFLLARNLKQFEEQHRRIAGPTIELIDAPNQKSDKTN